jgi:hypothetical protein
MAIASVEKNIGVGKASSIPAADKEHSQALLTHG